MSQVVTFSQGAAQLQSAMNIGLFFSAFAELMLILLFIGSVYKTLRAVPNEQCVVPKWFLWFLLLPVVGVVLFVGEFELIRLAVIDVLFLVFAWILIPFAVPNSLARHYAANNELVKRVNTLQRIGLSATICLTAYLIGYLGYLSDSLLILQGIAAGVQASSLTSNPFLILQRVSSLPYIVLAIIYWCKIVSFRSAANKLS
jgi:hypothetical protein